MPEYKGILAYLAGIIASDGNITCKKRTCKIKIMTINSIFAKKISNLLEIQQCQPAKIYEDCRRKRYEVYCYSKKFAQLLQEVYGIKPGKKAEEIILPNISVDLLINYIRGLYDGDSSITIVKVRMYKEGKMYEYDLPRIIYKTKSKSLAEELNRFLIDIGFRPRRWKDKDIYAIALEGVRELKKFHIKIGYLHPIKLYKLIPF